MTTTITRPGTLVIGPGPATPPAAGGVASPVATAAPAAPVRTPGPDAFDGSAPAKRTFDVYFTPHEDAYGYEAACIDEVIAARKADPTVYAEGQDPYRIQYMVFNIRNKDVVDKLFQAVKAGIHVQVLVEAEQIAPSRTWNKVAEQFEQQGLKVLRSDKGVDKATSAGVHLVGIDKNSLMHMKARIFHWKDPESGEVRSKVLSGSLNPNGAPVMNDENLNVMTDPALVARYEKRFAEVRDHKLARNEWKDDQSVNVLFTPYVQGGPTPTQKLFDWIDAEKEMILISVFQLHDLKARGVQDSLIDKLKKAMDRGVTVMAITDRRKSDGTDEKGNRVMSYGRPAPDDDTDEAMAAAGIPVLELVNTSNEFAAVHGKSVTFGLENMRVMTDAGNWTVAAMGSEKADPRNEESFLFVDSAKLDGNATGKAYLSNFLHLLRKYDDQYPEEAESLIRKLQAQPTWPKVAVDLSLFARAHPGKEVFLVCDHPDIKARTPAGAPGMPIPATSSSPPFRPADPVKLPFGTTLSFQVAVRDPVSGAVDVKKGDQVLVVDTPAHGG
jgi:hypothetical protein